MHDVLRIHVLYLLYQLVGEVEPDVFAHATVLLAEVEEYGALDVFHDNVDTVANELIIVLDNAIISVFEDLDDAFMRHLSEDLYLFTDIAHGVLHLHVRGRHYFDSELERGLVDVAGEPDFASGSATDHLDQVIGIVEPRDCHLLVGGQRGHALCF